MSYHEVSDGQSASASLRVYVMAEARDPVSEGRVEANANSFCRNLLVDAKFLLSCARAVRLHFTLNEPARAVLVVDRIDIDAPVADVGGIHEIATSFIDFESVAKDPPVSCPAGIFNLVPTPPLAPPALTSIS